MQVCPTGIDIRDGLQYECIGCALCVDACNSVMDKMGYEPGLIRYATENSLKGKKTHIMRPRLLGYVVAMTLMVGLLAYNIADRDVIELSVLRDRQALFTEVQDGMIENSYTVKIANKTQQEHRYQVVVESEINFENFHKQEISLQSGELLDLPMRLQARADSLPSSRSPITISVRQMDKESSVAEVESSFFGPVPQR